MRTPKVNDFCKVLYDGRECRAVVTSVHSDKKTFDATTSFKDNMYNIPFDEFTYSPDLGNMIVNSIELEFGLGLKTVDAIDMTAFINGIISENKWMIR